jgi:hypothetical protein
LAARAPGGLAVAIVGDFQRLKARALADLVGDDGIKAGGVLGTGSGDYTGHLPLRPGIMVLVSFTVEEYLHATEDVDLAFDGLKAFQMISHHVLIAGFFRLPVTLCKAETPKPSSEARGKRFTGGGEGIAATVKVTLKDWKADSNSGAAHYTAQDFAAAQSFQ